jgi:hypothetical protein
MTMKILLLSSVLLSAATAFHVMPQSMQTSRRWALKDVDEKHLSFNPLEGYQGVDVNRAKECAEHFGKCSVEEMEELYNSECYTCLKMIR